VNDILSWIIIHLNAPADALGGKLLAPLGMLPGWLSATLVAAVTGVLLLVAFKYTSNQRAIKQVRDDLDANLLALKLFKDSTSVTLRSQGHMIVDAFRLMLLALVPMLAIALPVTLLLGQLALWYQSRPLRVGEEAVLTLALGGDANAPWPEVRLRPNDAVQVEIGPVRVRSKREVCWTIEGRRTGLHRLAFDVDGRPVDKQFAVGNGFMRVSAIRPGWDWLEILYNPAEEPFRPTSTVRSIAVQFPSRTSWTSGTDSWVIYWFAVSMVGALVFRRTLNVKV
jgi:hypothetical protein